MKDVFKQMFKRAPKKRLALLAVTLATLIAIPLQSLAAVDVLLEGSIGVANQTTGETTYKESTNASYDQVVKFQVFYHNRELADSGRVAKNFKIKVDMPTQPGTNQTVKVTMGGDNTNTITDTATVVLNRSDAHLEFIPGSTYWKHNVGTRQNIQYQTTNIPDSTILEGKVLESNLQPCHEFEATVTFMARVRVPSVSVKKEVRKKGSTGAGVTQMAVKPGDHLEYLLTAKNIGNATLNNVVLRDKLPAHITFVPGTVKLYNGPNPNGVVINNDYLFQGGVNAGTVGPGATVFISFEAKVAAEDELECGNNSLKNIVVVKSTQTGEYNNNATVTVTRECKDEPVFACDAVTVAKLGGREIRVSVDTTALNGATVKSYTYDFGDGSTPLVTDKNPVEYTYAKDGDYAVRVKVTFQVGDKTEVVESDSCVDQVSFETPVTPGKVLPATGAGEVFGVFTAVTIAGAVWHRLFWSRRFN